jgi:HPt (histidine-containing phosphotransfer) domain-containing protein
MSSKTGAWERDSARDAFALGTPPAQIHGVAGDKSAAIDLPSLLRRCLDDTTFCGMILHKFASRSADQLAALERALAAGNVLELAREAHTLQGVAANLSAPLLRSRAEELEAAAGHNDLPRARQAFDLARAEVSRCTALVPELMDRLAL